MKVYAKWYDHNKPCVLQVNSIEAAYERLAKFKGKVRVVVVRGYHKIGCQGRDTSEYNPRTWTVNQIKMMEGLA